MDSIEYEALRRASQMHRTNSSGKSKAEQKNQSPVQHQSYNKSEAERESAPCNKEETPPVENHNNGSNMLSNLFEDKEKLLVLALILILSAEETQDPALTLALLYLII